MWLTILLVLFGLLLVGVIVAPLLGRVIAAAHDDDYPTY